MRQILSLLLSLLLISPLYSQNKLIYRDKIYRENIKTVLLYRDGWEFTYPVLELDSDKSLILKFDDLSLERNDFNYTIIHCNSDWTPSNLNPIEYIEGFDEGQIYDSESSFNTLIQYTHYQLNIPNENFKPKLSGNYLLLVYEGFDKDNIVLSKRFFVVDSKVTIDASVRRSSVVSSINDSQEISFNITDKYGVIYNPQDNLNVMISQNNDQNFVINNLKPDFVKGNVLEFYNPRKYIFKGGNEFRYFNVKNYKIVNIKINSIQFLSPYYIFELIRESSIAQFTYSYTQDINGEMLIVADNVSDDELESEYVFVDFSFSNTYKSNGNFYVYGAVSDWDISKKNKMEYDFGSETYKLRMLLKQGFYNYRYVFVETGTNTIDLSFSEGNFYETENNYVIYVYHKPQGSEYDQLIGYKILNSIKRL